MPIIDQKLQVIDKINLIHCPKSANHQLILRVATLITKMLVIAQKFQVINQNLHVIDQKNDNYRPKTASQ